ncbi:hypothetical protein HMPREF0971_01440 [Segatella oris F0302]|uniref:Uncharacterized protein n=1 Tax=Segatella oris F0302 TaxID=649760 RepID=D1QR37_9BACT|nr:hypothetical protein HMPREF0971_01440 [Segatella oris F0302]
MSQKKKIGSKIIRLFPPSMQPKTVTVIQKKKIEIRLIQLFSPSL